MDQDYYKRIAQASTNKAGINVRDGEYEWLVEKITMQKGRKDVQYIPELRVVRSQAVRGDVMPNAVGEVVRCVWNLSKDSTPGNIKTFLVELLGIDENSISEEQMQKYTAASHHESQPFRGIRLAGSTYRYENQGKDNPANKGKEMVLVNWKHVPGQTEAAIAEGRALLDAGGPKSSAPQVAPPPTAPAPVSAPAPTQTPPAGGFLGGLFGK